MPYICSGSANEMPNKAFRCSQLPSSDICSENITLETSSLNFRRGVDEYGKYSLYGKSQKGQRWKIKVAFLAFKSRNFEKVYKINVKIWTTQFWCVVNRKGIGSTSRLLQFLFLNLLLIKNFEVLFWALGPFFVMAKIGSNLGDLGAISSKIPPFLSLGFILLKK